LKHEVDVSQVDSVPAIESPAIEYETLKAFQARHDLSTARLAEHILLRYRDTIRVKKAHVATANLARILDATLRLANRTAFHSVTVRDLAEATGLSMGALYTYVETKDTLLSMILTTVAQVVEDVLETPPAAVQEDPLARLRWLLTTHVYLTETMLPWFVFAYLEAKAFPPEARAMATASERRTEGLIAEALSAARTRGAIGAVDVEMTAALIKPLIQDWYVKRSKYRRRGISPEFFAQSVIAFVERSLIGHGIG
jgi:AcrR family transcriptional regulator